MAKSKPIPKFRAIIKRVGEHLKPVPLNDTLTQYLDLRFKEGQPVNIAITRHFKKRTTGAEDEKSNQNGYYWGVVIPILGEYFGYLPWEMHDALHPIFFDEPSDKDPNIKRRRSSSELNKLEWEETMERIRIWASAEHQVVIPEPNEVLVDNEGDN